MRKSGRHLWCGEHCAFGYGEGVLGAHFQRGRTCDPARVWSTFEPSRAQEMRLTPLPTLASRPASNPYAKLRTFAP